MVLGKNRYTATMKKENLVFCLLRCFLTLSSFPFFRPLMHTAPQMHVLGKERLTTRGRVPPHPLVCLRCRQTVCFPTWIEQVESNAGSGAIRGEPYEPRPIIHGPGRSLTDMVPKYTLASPQTRWACKGGGAAESAHPRHCLRRRRPCHDPLPGRALERVTFANFFSNR